MKIGIMGTSCTGKSTFIDDFIKQWPMYKKCDVIRYNDIVSDKTKLNENGDEETQLIILNSLVDQVIQSQKEDYVIYDRTILDNLVYTLWLHHNNRASEEFVQNTIDITKNALVFYDIIFFTPISKTTPITFKPTENGTDSEIYRAEIDNIFKALVRKYNTNDKRFFPFDDKKGCPAIIEIFGDRKMRVELAKYYIEEDGGHIKDGKSLLTFDDPSVGDFV